VLTKSWPSATVVYSCCFNSFLWFFFFHDVHAVVVEITIFFVVQLQLLSNYSCHCPSLVIAAIFTSRKTCPLRSTPVRLAVPCD
jgi:hypothetical protein